jgi:predicted nucleic acid-binding protein
VIRPLVCDASALVAVLLDDGPDGRWAAEQLSAGPLAAPAIVPFDTANVIRRLESSGRISSDLAEQAHADLSDLDIELWSHRVLGDRAWALRRNLSIYDASYVALAELVDGTLVTLDRRLTGRRVCGAASPRADSGSRRFVVKLLAPTPIGAGSLR